MIFNSFKRTDHHFLPDSRLVITRFFYLGSDKRVVKIINRLGGLSKESAENFLSDILDRFSSRHGDIKKVFNNHFEKVRSLVEDDKNLDSCRRLLIGAYFTMEYSVASAALFNPSIVLHPDQGNTDPGDRRFILSFRAVGEGHISSVLFREGIIKKNSELHIKKRSDFLERGIISSKSDSFYEIAFNSDTDLSSRVIFPETDDEIMGLEDARFVKFVQDNGDFTYYATCTAYSGLNMYPKLIETKDFKHFRVTLLKGKGAENKGMALFPEKVNGRYVMISRQDNENIFIMYSDNVYFWKNPELLRVPEEPWEFVQIGNCGSPIKTAQGWLLITHGVGAVRQYCMGAILLDLNNPSRIIGVLRDPLLCPSEGGRNGYVPNVVYSCGALIHENRLILPYAVSDTSSEIVTFDVNKVIDSMEVPKDSRK